MEIISNLQKIGKNIVVQNIHVFHLLLRFYHFYHLLVSLPSLKPPLLWFISVATVVFYGIDMTCFWKIQSSVSSPPLFNRMFFILGFLVRLRLCVLGQNTTLVILCHQVSGIEGSSALRWWCSFWSLGQSSVQFVQCIVYGFFTLYLINNLWETEVMLTSVFSIHWWFLLTQSLIVAKWWLSNSSIPSCTSWHSAFYCKKEPSFLPHPSIHQREFINHCFGLSVFNFFQWLIHYFVA